MNTKELTEATEKIGLFIKNAIPEKLSSEIQYEYFLETHTLLTSLIHAATEYDQRVIDLIDGYDAQKFKEALGL